MKNLYFLLIFLIMPIIYSDQPIMNMMPRWDNGYGWQILYESYKHEDLYRGDQIIRKGWDETVNQIHIQGVYTWDRSIRITAKLPIVLDARREQLVDGNKIIQNDKGLGDLTLALPLKKYFNLLKRTGSWTFAPQLRIPLNSRDNYNVWDHAFGRGVYLGYETETRNWFFSTGGSYWIFDKGEPSYQHYNFDLGWNAKDNMQILWENDFHYQDDGKEFISAGPALYYRQSDNTHYRLEYKHSYKYSTANNKSDHIGGNRFNIGVGFVY